MRWFCWAALAVFAWPVAAEPVVILPYFNLSQNKSLDWIGESIAETVRETLQSEGVITRDRMERRDAFRRLGIHPYTRLTKASVLKLAESLDADQIVYGHFEVATVDPASKSKGALQIVTSILDLKSLRTTPDLRESCALEDLAIVQNHLAWHTLRVLAPRSVIPEDEFNKRRPVTRLDAMENYIRGLLASSEEQKLRYFQQSARLDPHSQQPSFQLGRMQWEKKNYRPAAELFQKISLTDPNGREAHYYLGLCRYYLGDYAAAEREFRGVAQLVPLNEVFNNLGLAQSRAGQAESLQNLRHALEGDETDGTFQFNVGYELWKRSEFSQAAQRFRAVLDRDPDDAQAMQLLGRCLKGVGPKPGAPAENFERAKENYEETAYWQLKAVLEPKSK